MRRRWYGNVLPRNEATNTDQPSGKVQMESLLRAGRVTHIAEPILRLAHAEYMHQFGDQQDYERMQERGGLGILEVVGLLADYVERLGGKPTWLKWGRHDDELEEDTPDA